MRVPKSERIKIFEDKELLIVIPLTHRVACKYGAFTKWCTAAISEPKHFDIVNKTQSIIIYYIFKKTNEKYCKHIIKNCNIIWIWNKNNIKINELPFSYGLDIDEKIIKVLNLQFS